MEKVFVTTKRELIQYRQALCNQLGNLAYTELAKNVEKVHNFGKKQVETELKPRANL